MKLLGQSPSTFVQTSLRRIKKGIHRTDNTFQSSHTTIEIELKYILPVTARRKRREECYNNSELYFHRETCSSYQKKLLSPPAHFVLFLWEQFSSSSRKSREGKLTLNDSHKEKRWKIPERKSLIHSFGFRLKRLSWNCRSLLTSSLILHISLTPPCAATQPKTNDINRTTMRIGKWLRILSHTPEWSDLSLTQQQHQPSVRPSCRCRFVICRLCVWVY